MPTDKIRIKPSGLMGSNHANQLTKEQLEALVGHKKADSTLVRRAEEVYDHWYRHGRDHKVVLPHKVLFKSISAKDRDYLLHLVELYDLDTLNKLIDIMLDQWAVIISKKEFRFAAKLKTPSIVVLYYQREQLYNLLAAARSDMPMATKIDF